MLVASSCKQWDLRAVKPSEPRVAPVWHSKAPQPPGISPIYSHSPCLLHVQGLLQLNTLTNSDCPEDLWQSFISLVPITIYPKLAFILIPDIIIWMNIMFSPSPHISFLSHLCYNSIITLKQFCKISFKISLKACYHKVLPMILGAGADGSTRINSNPPPQSLFLGKSP